LTSLETAAEVVEAIDDREVQARRDWDLSEWRYELIPWGVRFQREVPKHSGQAEILAVLGRTGADGATVPESRPDFERPESFVVTV